MVILSRGYAQFVVFFQSRLLSSFLYLVIVSLKLP